LAKKEAPDKTPKQKETLMEFISSMSVVLVIGLFIITFNLQAFEIPSSSMEDTLLIGDHVFVDRMSYAPPSHLGPLMPYRDIRRGDIVVFLSVTDPGMYIVKRIMGLPGDRIRLRDGVVYRNGEKLDEPYMKKACDDYGNPPCYSPYRDNFPAVAGAQSEVPPTPEWSLLMPLNKNANDELVVPNDRYFAMGDNRFASYDSRYWGFIPRENVIGRPMFIYWSFETPRDQYQKQSARERVSFIGHVVLHFFDETRWRRTLRMVR
jgi:signal peptidase I